MPRRRRLLRLPGRLGRAGDDVDAELAFHLAMREAKLRAAGIDPTQARQQARERFGDVAAIHAECVQSERRLIQRERRMTFGEEIASDVRNALRSARRARGFTITALLTIALGIGATTAVFSIVRGVLLRPLPYPAADRIVRVFGAVNNWDAPLSSPNFRDFRAQTRSLSALGAYVWNVATITGLGDPLRVMSASLYGDFFGALGVRPVVGRALTPDETRTGGPRRAVVSYDFWMNHLGGDRRLEDLHIALRGGSYDIVGVMPPGFGYPNRTQVWIGSFYTGSESLRAGYQWSAVGRLRDGVTLDAARAELDAIGKRLEATYGRADAGLEGARVRLLKEDVVGSRRTPLLFLFGAVALVLLVACVNVATAALARGETRQMELGIRAALGAGRARLMRQTLTEHLVVALLGGALGAGIAVVLTRALGALGPQATGLPRLQEIAVDGGALAFAFAATLVVGSAIGMLPAWQAGRAALRGTLARGGRGNTGDGSRARRLLVTAEVALAIALTVGAGLLIKSFARLQEVRPGFNPHNVLMACLALPGAKYKEEQRPEFFRQLVEQLESLPGVQAAGGSVNLPLYASNYAIGRAFIPEGRPLSVDEAADASYSTITGDYFRAMQIPLLAGRVFDVRDNANGPKVAIVNESLAKRVFGSVTRAIGKRLNIWRDEKFPREIVGVVGDTKAGALEAASGAQIYVPHAQDPQWNFMGLVVRTAGDPAAFANTLRHEVQALDKDQPIYSVRTMDDVVINSLGTRRVSMQVFAVFAGAALLLAALGIYGVMAYSVTQRTQEIGIRMALGAQKSDVLGLVIRQGMTLAIIGIAIGLAGAFALTRLIANLLFGVATTDPFTFFAIPLLLLFVALVACYLPARRAARLNPVNALAQS